MLQIQFSVLSFILVLIADDSMLGWICENLFCQLDTINFSFHHNFPSKKVMQYIL